jgi:hypothetical protein
VGAARVVVVVVVRNNNFSVYAQNLKYRESHHSKKISEKSNLVQTSVPVELPITSANFLPFFQAVY